MPSKPEVLIAGTGAMACLFGARLSAHARVTLLGTWEQGLQALREGGVRLVETDGTESTHRVAVSDDPRRCGAHRLALVLVKSWQTARAARQLSACLHPEGVALTLQNGLGNLERLQETLGVERAALGVTTTGATLLGPGRVRAGGSGPTHLARHPRLGPLADLLGKAGFEIALAKDLERLVWGKLAINAAINPLTALLRIPNGELLHRPYALGVAVAAAEETAAVAEALGVCFPYPDPGAVVMQVAERTGGNRSSMLQDVCRHAPTEIDAINGAVARQARRAGVSAPVNWTLWHLIRALVSISAGEET